MDAPQFHIVITRSRFLLIRRPGVDWRAVQDEFADYMASLGPYTLEEALEMIGVEWPEVLQREREIGAFAAGGEADLDLSD